MSPRSKPASLVTNSEIAPPSPIPEAILLASTSNSDSCSDGPESSAAASDSISDSSSTRLLTSTYSADSLTNETSALPSPAEIASISPKVTPSGRPTEREAAVEIIKFSASLNVIVRILAIDSTSVNEPICSVISDWLD